MRSRDEVRELLRRRSNRPLDLGSVLIVLFVPVLLFAVVYWIFGYSLRFHLWPVALLLGPVLGLLVCLGITSRAWAKLKQDGSARAWIALAVCSWIALILATIRADMAYWSYSHPHYMYKELADYVNIDPSVDKGQAYMDSGQVYFKENSYVDTATATAYRSGMTFCVAPIVRQPPANQGGASQVAVNGPMVTPESGTVDWWAVGTNCCNPSGKEFKCGAVNNTEARSGLRLMRDDVRPFFLMAVQEWSAGLNIPVKHPLFFYWVQDPLAEVDEYGTDGDHMYWVDLFGFFILNFGLTFSVMYLLYSRSIK
mmetsp:Transcript_12139/g.28339  ORF Transcript_12139/g.28339 Transcript_12139/m.28339 type:complete len:311 (+) Transcript_12139:77-1009(+)